VLKLWNIHTQSWLARYVNMRAPRSVSRYLTYATSAFWHGAWGSAAESVAMSFVSERARVQFGLCCAGFFPGYYTAFFSVAFQQEAIQRVLGSGAGRSNQSMLARFGMWMITLGCLDYSLSAFCLLDFARGIAVWRSFYFVGHVVPVLAILYSLFVGGKRSEAKRADASAGKSAKSA
jgi:hypothetical protein